MDSKTLEKNITNLERELVALQTAHDVGLGAIEFYSYTGIAPARRYSEDWPESHYLAIMITVHDGEPLNPVIQGYIQADGIGNKTSIGNYMMQHSNSKFSFFDAGLGIGLPPVSQYLYRVDSTSRLDIEIAESLEQYEEWVRNAE